CLTTFQRLYRRRVVRCVKRALSPSWSTPGPPTPASCSRSSPRACRKPDSPSTRRRRCRDFDLDNTTRGDSTVRISGQRLLSLPAIAFLVLTAGGIATGGGDPPPTPKTSAPAETVTIVPRLLDHFGDSLPEGAILRLGTTRLRHVDVCALAFTPDNELVSF